MDIYRVTVRWSGFQGSPGFSSFHFSSGFLDGGAFGDEVAVLADRVAGALGDLAPLLPDVVRVAVEPEVAVIDSDTGMVQSYHDRPPVSPRDGSGGSSYSAPSGAVVNWRTNDLRFGRRIQGRTFLVPLANSVYEDDGTLTALARASLTDFAEELMGGPLDAGLVVWSRPRNGAGGVAATVTSFNVPDMAAVLRSRRD